MTDIEKEFNIDLKHPFEYAHGGQKVKAQFLLVKAPSPRVKVIFRELKQLFTSALYNFQDNLPANLKKQAEEAQQKVAAEKAASANTSPEVKQENEADRMDCETALQVIYGSNVNLRKLTETFESMITQGNGLVLVDGQEKVTANILNEMSVEDSDKLLGEYFARFFASAS